MSTYNGHKNWNHWNVSLWINNDQGLYLLACEYARLYLRDYAAKMMFNTLKETGQTHTPDGAPYSKTSILAAMRGIN